MRALTGVTLLWVFSWSAASRSIFNAELPEHSAPVISHQTFTSTLRKVCGGSSVCKKHKWPVRVVWLAHYIGAFDAREEMNICRIIWYGVWLDRLLQFAYLALV